MIEYTVKVYGNGANGTTHWYLNGERHREDGPAVEYSSGTKIWYLNGERHREDGPAKEGANGSKEWWLNGKRHREDGPAVEYSNGTNYWYLNDVMMTEAEHKAKMNPVDYAEFAESMVLTKGQDRLVENTLGLVGEAGEVAEKIKKKLRDGSIDIQGLQKELGDVIFYWYALHGALGLDPEVTKSMNKDKLNSRKERGTLQGNGDNR